MNAMLVKGTFAGGDLEDGTFHGGDIAPGTFHYGDTEETGKEVDRN